MISVTSESLNPADDYRTNVDLLFSLQLSPVALIAECSVPPPSTWRQPSLLEDSTKIPTAAAEKRRKEKISRKVLFWS